ncbi:glycosyltransferase [Altibacter sp.]|uniref:glycosyltransferase n=1 Tax=Altibacter sp. TaxID=2024823 RepID=UPI000C9605ED|nr:glycosyltransferase [Altibacter sp.]MAP54813.1 mannosyltransferase [Altibacter sp.]
MIPKILHYCWFGPHPKSAVAKQCMESWRIHCPDYEIKEWNETTSKPYLQPFVKDALRKKRYAFAADAVRVQALLEHGGIYLDTDMLLLQSPDRLRTYDFFSGFEVPDRVAYGCFGAVSGHRFLQAMCDFYADKRFDGFNPPVITHTFKELIAQDRLASNERLFDSDVFYALPYDRKDEAHTAFTTPNSIAVHLWDHSWARQKNESVGQLLAHLGTVLTDYLGYGYPFSYFQRYGREFSRKLYHRLRHSASA